MSEETSTRWTPGAGWERLKREMPGMVPDLTDEDMRRADEIIAAAGGSAPISEEPAHPDDDVNSLKQRIAEYENAITWNVSCFGCAKQLDGLIAERAAGYEEGLADGRRQATEGWERQWAIEVEDGPPYQVSDEGHARWHLGRGYTTGVRYRLVGPWEPAEQPEGSDRG